MGQLDSMPTRGRCAHKNQRASLSSVLSPRYAILSPPLNMPALLMLNVQGSVAPGSGMMTSGASGDDAQQPISGREGAGGCFERGRWVDEAEVKLRAPW